LSKEIHELFVGLVNLQITFTFNIKAFMYNQAINLDQTTDGGGYHLKVFVSINSTLSAQMCILAHLTYFAF